MNSTKWKIRRLVPVLILASQLCLFSPFASGADNPPEPQSNGAGNGPQNGTESGSSENWKEKLNKQYEEKLNELEKLRNESDVLNKKLGSLVDFEDPSLWGNDWESAAQEVMDEMDNIDMKVRALQTELYELKKHMRENSVMDGYRMITSEKKALEKLTVAADQAMQKAQKAVQSATTVKEQQAAKASMKAAQELKQIAERRSKELIDLGKAIAEAQQQRRYTSREINELYLRRADAQAKAAHTVTSELEKKEAEAAAGKQRDAWHFAEEAEDKAINEMKEVMQNMQNSPVKAVQDARNEVLNEQMGFKEIHKKISMQERTNKTSNASKAVKKAVRASKEELKNVVKAQEYAMNTAKAAKEAGDAAEATEAAANVIKRKEILSAALEAEKAAKKAAKLLVKSRMLSETIILGLMEQSIDETMDAHGFVEDLGPKKMEELAQQVMGSSWADNKTEQEELKKALAEEPTATRAAQTAQRAAEAAQKRLDTLREKAGILSTEAASGTNIPSTTAPKGTNGMVGPNNGPTNGTGGVSESGPGSPGNRAGDSSGNGPASGASGSGGAGNGSGKGHGNGISNVGPEDAPGGGEYEKSFAELEKQAKSGLKYGVMGGPVRKPVKDILLKHLDGKGLTPAEKEAVAEALARMEEGNLRLLVSLRVLKPGEAEALIDINRKTGNRLRIIDPKKLENLDGVLKSSGDFPSRLEAVVEGYRLEKLSPSVMKQMLRRLVPTQWLKWLSQHYGASLADMIRIVGLQDNFLGWLFQNIDRVNELAKIMGPGNAWRYVSGKGGEPTWLKNLGENDGSPGTAPEPELEKLNAQLQQAKKELLEVNQQVIRAQAAGGASDDLLAKSIDLEDKVDDLKTKIVNFKNSSLTPYQLKQFEKWINNSQKEILESTTALANDIDMLKEARIRLAKAHGIEARMKSRLDNAIKNMANVDSAREKLNVASTRVVKEEQRVRVFEKTAEIEKARLTQLQERLDRQVTRAQIDTKPWQSGVTRNTDQNILERLEQLGRKPDMAHGLAKAHSFQPVVDALSGILDGLGLSPEVKKELANTLARMSEGSLRGLQILGVLTEAEVDALLSKNALTMKEVLGPHFKSQLKGIVEKYNATLSKTDLKMMLKRLVPEEWIVKMAERYGIPRSTLIQIIGNKENFLGWILDNKVKVEQMAKTGIKESQAWRILLRQGEEARKYSNLGGKEAEQKSQNKTPPKGKGPGSDEPPDNENPGSDNGGGNTPNNPPKNGGSGPSQSSNSSEEAGTNPNNNPSQGEKFKGIEQGSPTNSEFNPTSKTLADRNKKSLEKYGDKLQPPSTEGQITAQGADTNKPFPNQSINAPNNGPKSPPGDNGNGSVSTASGPGNNGAANGGIANSKKILKAVGFTSDSLDRHWYGTTESQGHAKDYAKHPELKVENAQQYNDRAVEILNAPENGGPLGKVEARVQNGDLLRYRAINAKEGEFAVMAPNGNVKSLHIIRRSQWDNKIRHSSRLSPDSVYANSREPLKSNGPPKTPVGENNTTVTSPPEDPSGELEDAIEETEGFVEDAQSAVDIAQNAAARLEKMPQLQGHANSLKQQVAAAQKKITTAQEALIEQRKTLDKIKTAIDTHQEEAIKQGCDANKAAIDAINKERTAINQLAEVQRNMRKTVDDAIVAANKMKTQVIDQSQKAMAKALNQLAQKEAQELEAIQNGMNGPTLQELEETTEHLPKDMSCPEKESRKSQPTTPPETTPPGKTPPSTIPPGTNGSAGAVGNEKLVRPVSGEELTKLRVNSRNAAIKIERRKSKAQEISSRIEQGLNKQEEALKIAEDNLTEVNKYGNQDKIYQAEKNLKLAQRSLKAERQKLNKLKESDWGTESGRKAIVQEAQKEFEQANKALSEAQQIMEEWKESRAHLDVQTKKELEAKSRAELANYKKGVLADEQAKLDQLEIDLDEARARVESARSSLNEMQSQFGLTKNETNLEKVKQADKELDDAYAKTNIIREEVVRQKREVMELEIKANKQVRLAEKSMNEAIAGSISDEEAWKVAKAKFDKAKNDFKKASDTVHNSNTSPTREQKDNLVKADLEMKKARKELTKAEQLLNDKSQKSVGQSSGNSSSPTKSSKEETESRRRELKLSEAKDQLAKANKNLADVEQELPKNLREFLKENPKPLGIDLDSFLLKNPDLTREQVYQKLAELNKAKNARNLAEAYKKLQENNVSRAEAKANGNGETPTIKPGNDEQPPYSPGHKPPENSSGGSSTSESEGASGSGGPRRPGYRPKEGTQSKLQRLPGIGSESGGGTATMTEKKPYRPNPGLGQKTEQNFGPANTHRGNGGGGNESGGGPSGGPLENNLPPGDRGSGGSGNGGAGNGPPGSGAEGGDGNGLPSRTESSLRKAYDELDTQARIYKKLKEAAEAARKKADALSEKAITNVEKQAADAAAKAVLELEELIEKVRTQAKQIYSAIEKIQVKMVEAQQEATELKLRQKEGAEKKLIENSQNAVKQAQKAEEDAIKKVEQKISQTEKNPEQALKDTRAQVLKEKQKNAPAEEKFRKEYAELGKKADNAIIRRDELIRASEEEVKKAHQAVENAINEAGRSAKEVEKGGTKAAIDEAKRIAAEAADQVVKRQAIEQAAKEAAKAANEAADIWKEAANQKIENEITKYSEDAMDLGPVELEVIDVTKIDEEAKADQEALESQAAEAESRAMQAQKALEAAKRNAGDSVAPNDFRRAPVPASGKPPEIPEGPVKPPNSTPPVASGEGGERIVSFTVEVDSKGQRVYRIYFENGKSRTGKLAQLQEAFPKSYIQQEVEKFVDIQEKLNRLEAEHDPNNAQEIESLKKQLSDKMQKAKQPKPPLSPQEEIKYREIDKANVENGLKNTESDLNKARETAQRTQKALTQAESKLAEAKKAARIAEKAYNKAKANLESASTQGEDQAIKNLKEAKGKLIEARNKVNDLKGPVKQKSDVKSVLDDKINKLEKKKASLENGINGSATYDDTTDGGKSKKALDWFNRPRTLEEELVYRQQLDKTLAEIYKQLKNPNLSSIKRKELNHNAQLIQEERMKLNVEITRLQAQRAEANKKPGAKQGSPSEGQTKKPFKESFAREGSSVSLKEQIDRIDELLASPKFEGDRQKFLKLKSDLEKKLKSKPPEGGEFRPGSPQGPESPGCQGAGCSAADNAASNEARAAANAAEIAKEQIAANSEKIAEEMAGKALKSTLPQSCQCLKLMTGLAGKAAGKTLGVITNPYVMVAMHELGGTKMGDASYYPPCKDPCIDLGHAYVTAYSKYSIAKNSGASQATLTAFYQDVQTLEKILKQKCYCFQSNNKDPESNGFIFYTKSMLPRRPLSSTSASSTQSPQSETNTCISSYPQSTVNDYMNLPANKKAAEQAPGAMPCGAWHLSNSNNDPLYYPCEASQTCVPFYEGSECGYCEGPVSTVPGCMNLIKDQIDGQQLTVPPRTFCHSDSDCQNPTPYCELSTGKCQTCLSEKEPNHSYDQGCSPDKTGPGRKIETRPALAPIPKSSCAKQPDGVNICAECPGVGQDESCQSLPSGLNHCTEINTCAQCGQDSDCAEITNCGRDVATGLMFFGLADIGTPVCYTQSAFRGASSATYRCMCWNGTLHEPYPNTRTANKSSFSF